MNRWTVLSPLTWIIVIVALGLALRAAKVVAEPVAAFDNGGVRIVVYTEHCAMTGVVTNLPNKATWTESGKTLEGCVQAFPQFGVAAFYFADKTVAIVPLSMFERVVGS